MKNIFKISPDWESLDKETLKIYKLMGLIIFIIGLTILIIFLPTIKFWFKFLGGAILGYGVKIFLTANRFLNK